MSKRLSTKDVKELFEKYGYSLSDDFKYKNNTTKYKVYDNYTNKYENLNLKQLQYRINKGRSEYDIFNDFYNIAISDEEPIVKNKSNNNKIINTITKDLIKKLLLQKDFTYNVNHNNDNIMLYALMFSIRNVGPKINKKIRMTVYDDNNNPVYYYGNQNTVNFLYNIINDNDHEYSDSNTAALDKFKNIKSIKFEFVDIGKGKRVGGGFFSYINTTDIDLTKFGIFNDIKNDYINEPCLIQSFIASNIFTDNEINMLKSFINTRTIPLEQLKYISDLLKVHINVKYDNSHRDYGIEYDKKIRLLIIDGHYMLNGNVNVTMNCLRNYNENHTIEYNPKGLPIKLVINTMKKLNLLVPMDITTYNKLLWGYNNKYAYYNSYRKIIVNNKKDIPKFVKRMKHNKLLFGYDISEKDIEYRLNELQNIITNKLHLNIDVRKYYRYSDLMLKIMYEYGCFDNVYELSGNVANNIRSELIFPKTIYNKGHLKGKYYYIDLNGAYMSSVTSIPTGMPDNNGNFNGENTKIKELIEKLYSIRMDAKNNNNDKLSTTIKFMMNSCWGLSIKKPNNFNKKYKDNKTKFNKYMDTYSPYVIGYDNKGFIYTVNPYREYYTFPQFARSVLDDFNDKMNYIKSLVSNVYYSKVDSLLISEDDYNKLYKLGYIGNNLGQFKVEHIFTEIYIKSADNWIGKNIENKYIYHVNNKYKNKCIKSEDPIKTFMEI